MSDSIPHTWKSSTDVQRRSVFARLDTLEAQVAALEARNAEIQAVIATLMQERQTAIEQTIAFKAEWDANEARYRADRDAMEARHQRERDRHKG